MCRKKYEPHKCEFVPYDEVLLFCVQNKHVLEAVHQRWLVYYKALFNNQFNRLKRSYVFGHPVGRVLTELIRIKFRYADSSLSTADTQTRFLHIYRENRDKIWTLSTHSEEAQSTITAN